MNRYDAATGKIARRIEIGLPGIGLVLVPPGEHLLVAQEISAKLAECPIVQLERSLLLRGPRCAIVGGLPRESESRRKLLAEVNGRRDWIAKQSRCLIVVLDRYELAEFQRFAGDVYSAHLFLEIVPFEPDSSIDAQQAREVLKHWQRKRFGHLDLRGFVRSETEDVSWPIEDIYQQIRCASWTTRKQLELPLQNEEAALTECIAAAIQDDFFQRMVVVLGHPGSGKTFFLRWLAMQAATQERQWGIVRPLPMLLSLSAFVRTPGPISLYDCLVENLLLENQPSAHVLSLAVTERRAIFLLDGLDEVGDESARQRVTEAVLAFGRKVEGCLIVVTSRIAGYDTTVLPGRHFVLTPFNEDDIRNFLVRWCELYAKERLGSGQFVARDGRAEGMRLANDVLANSGVSELARSPLLLTVLAIVHRAGVRLPDHRVELYEHATRVLVERWNRVRSLSRVEHSLPLKVADAVRLLGPVALRTVRAGSRGAIPEEVLQNMLGRALADGNLRGVASPSEAIDLFRNSLGLLVEQGPGLFAFLHLTLAEYFAAWELVRSGELEDVSRNPAVAYSPEWREIILLAAGVLGINRADDVRLAKLVETLIDSASHKTGKPSGAVPSLLGGLLVDDPGLSLHSAVALIQELIPMWWFERRYGRTETLALVVNEATSVALRVMRSRFAGEFRTRVEEHYGSGAHPAIVDNLLRSPNASILVGFVGFLRVAGIDVGPVILHLLQERGSALPRRSFPVAGTRLAVANGSVWVEVFASQWLDNEVRVRGMNLALRIRLFEYEREKKTWNIRFDTTIPWAQTQRVSGRGQTEVVLKAKLSWAGSLSFPHRVSVEILIGADSP